MILLIDYREKKFIDKFKNKGESILIDENNEIYSLKIDKTFTINYKISNLDIGDFLICNYNLDTDTNSETNSDTNSFDLKFIYENLVLLIERKTYGDLSSSIIDGRFREQKSRIEECLNNNDKVMYIIEGTNENKKHGVKTNILEGAILNLIFRHKFKVLNTTNIDETIQNIITIFKKYKKKEFVSTCQELKEIIENNEITTQINEKDDTVPEIKFTNLKKSDRISNNIFNLQLCVIPGVSINIAKKITSEYNSISELITAYNQINENIELKECLLADIKITEKRKLGKALSKKIYNALHSLN